MSIHGSWPVRASSAIVRVAIAGFAFLSIAATGVPGLAQESGAESQRRDADEIYADAVSAAEAEDYRRALDLLELAQMREPRPKFVYRKILVLESMGKPDRAHELLNERRKDLAGAPGVGDLNTLEERLRSKVNGSGGGGTNPGDNPASNSSRPRTLSWLLVGGGGAFAATGTAFLLVANRKTTQLNCAVRRTEGSSANCGDASTDATLTDAEYQSRVRTIRGFRWGGVALLGVGVGALGWGATRLLLGDRKSSRARIRFRVTPGPAPAARLQVRF